MIWKLRFAYHMIRITGYWLTLSEYRFAWQTATYYAEYINHDYPNHDPRQSVIDEIGQWYD